MLDDPGTNPDPLPPAGQQGSERIVVRESAFANLAEVAQQVLGDAREMAKRVNALLSDENQAQLSAALKNVEIATRQVTQLAKSMEPAARGSTALVADARKTFERADKLLDEISGTNRELATRLDAIDRMADSAQKAGGSVSSLAEAVTEGTLPRINLLAEELSRTSRSLDRLASGLETTAAKPGVRAQGRTARPRREGIRSTERRRSMTAGLRPFANRRTLLPLACVLLVSSCALQTPTSDTPTRYDFRPAPVTRAIQSGDTRHFVGDGGPRAFVAGRDRHRVSPARMKILPGLAFTP